jgi:hypothetical protein
MVPFDAEELRLRVESEGGNRQLAGGGQSCGRCERESFVGIPVAQPSVGSQTLSRRRVEPLLSGCANGRPEAVSVVEAVRDISNSHHQRDKKEK